MQENLAIASVPVQDWGALYGEEEALRVGTIFQDLNKPFFAASGDGAQSCPHGGETGAEKQGCLRGGETGAKTQDGQCGIGAGNMRQDTCRDAAASSQQQEREHMLARIQETSFALDDVRLYLDTHPDDRQGLALLKEKLAERKRLLLAYTEQFYPLTVDCMADLYGKDSSSECYCWQKGPMPWEGACV